MGRHLVRVMLRNLGVALIAVGAALTVSGFDLSVWRDGRLTSFDCALFAAALAYGAFRLWRLDRRIKAGKVNTYMLPVWLQDPSDAPEAGYRR